MELTAPLTSSVITDRAYMASEEMIRNYPGASEDNILDQPDPDSNWFYWHTDQGSFRVTVTTAPECPPETFQYLMDPDNPFEGL